MFSGSRALEFLGNQGVTALGNLVLSHRDYLLLDAWSTVPADLPSSPGIFPSSLLDSALTKMHAASNDALVQRTLHPSKIPRKSSSGPSKAGSSSASSADRGSVSPVVPWSQQLASTAPPLPLPSRVGRRGVATVRRTFRRPLAALAHPVANEKRPGKSPPDGLPPLLRVGGCLSAHWRHWQTIGADSWVLSVLRDGYHIPFLDSPSPLSRTPISFPMYRARSPRSLALRQEVEEMLSKDALEIVLNLGPVFYSRLFLLEKVTGRVCVCVGGGGGGVGVP